MVVHDFQRTAGASDLVLHHPPKVGSHGCRRWVFQRDPPTANRSRSSRRPHPDPHPTITTDCCPFFHDAKSRWVETHFAVRHQLPTVAGVRPKAGIRPHQRASAHPSTSASSSIR
ncbi:hypothetical protein ACLOJK_024032 [Asimina triloba]